jgi:hypothetical protein
MEDDRGGSPRGLGVTTNLEIMTYKDICRRHGYGRIELIWCNKLGIQSVASIALVVTLPLCLYKEGKGLRDRHVHHDTIASFQSTS